MTIYEVRHCRTFLVCMENYGKTGNEQLRLAAWVVYRLLKTRDKYKVVEAARLEAQSWFHDVELKVRTGQRPETDLQTAWAVRDRKLAWLEHLEGIRFWQMYVPELEINQELLAAIKHEQIDRISKFPEGHWGLGRLA